MKTGKGQGPKKKSPACTGPSQPFEFRSCPTISRQPCRAVQSDERNPYRSFYYADETLGGRKERPGDDCVGNHHLKMLLAPYTLN
jgi:hypothetical protein